MSPLRLSAVAVALAGMLPLTPLHAVTVVWDGAGPTAAWSAIDAKPGPGFGRTNWSGKNVFPDIGDDLVFDGGVRLSTSNDMAALTFDGSASVLGRFVNDGTVGGSGGTLTFLNDVSGGGGFAGDIVFHAGYSPGHSPARVDFGGRDANFDASAMLTIELDGADPGSGHDQLANIDRLDFDGRLRLVFGASYAPAAGTQWKLLDFDTFAGSLAPDRIDVAGFDRRRLDTSKLAVDGTLAVTAVPEPAAWTMWLSALLLAARVRRGAFNARAASACCAARVARQGRTVRPH